MIQNIDEFLAKIKQTQHGNLADLSTEEDLALAVMNLINLEEHFFFTGAKTQKNEYYDLINGVRETRKALMLKLIPHKPEGELWCASKHLLATSMRLMETGTKLQTQQKNKEAYGMFSLAYEVYNLFWKIKLGMMAPPGSEEKIGDEKTLSSKEQVDELMKQLIDCCKE